MDDRIKIELFDGEMGFTNKENKDLIDRIESAISYIDSHSHSSGTTNSATEKLWSALDLISTGEDDGYVFRQLQECIKEVKSASRYCGYTNIQHGTIRAVSDILEDD